MIDLADGIVYNQSDLYFTEGGPKNEGYKGYAYRRNAPDG